MTNTPTGQQLAAPVTPASGTIYVETLKQGRDMAEQRAAALQARVHEQDAEIERLNAEIEKLKAKK